jgi:hypothetical protein
MNTPAQTGPKRADTLPLGWYIRRVLSGHPVSQTEVHIAVQELERLLSDNKKLRKRLRSERTGKPHEVKPPCGHAKIRDNCIECQRTDARRCVYWANESKRERDALEKYMQIRGIELHEFDRWVANGGMDEPRAPGRRGRYQRKANK